MELAMASYRSALLIAAHAYQTYQINNIQRPWCSRGPPCPPTGVRKRLSSREVTLHFTTHTTGHDGEIRRIVFSVKRGRVRKKKEKASVMIFADVE